MRNRTLAIGRRVMSAALVSVAMACALAGCGSGDKSSNASGYKLVNSGYLTVAYTDGDLPEIGAGAGKDKLVGTDGVLMEEIAKSLHLKLKPVAMAFPSQILAVKQGRADIGTTTYYTEERAKQVYYAYPFWKDTAGVYFRKNKGYDGVGSLKGKTVSTVQGYVWAPYLQKAYGMDHVKLFTNIADAYTALDNGQVDAFVNASGGALTPGFVKYRKTIDFKPFAPGDLKMPDSVLHDQAYNYVNCHNKALADKMNVIFKDLQSSHQWDKTLKKYKIASTPDNVPEMKSPKQLCD